MRLLLESATTMDWRRLDDCRTLGVTAGASAPEVLVEEFLAACRERFAATLEQIDVTVEDVSFNLPRALVA